MCYYLAFNDLCGISGTRCPFVYLKNKWAIACPKYRQWLGSLGLGSYCEPPVPNSAPLPREFELNEWERTQYKPAPF